MGWNGAIEDIYPVLRLCHILQINNSASVQPVDQTLTDSYLPVSLKPNCFPLTSVCLAGQLFPCPPVITPLQPKPLPAATLGMQTVQNRRICPVAQIARQFVCSFSIDNQPGQEVEWSLITSLTCGLSMSLLYNLTWPARGTKMHVNLQ